MEDDDLTLRGKIGLVIYTVTVILPGLIISGFMGELDVLPLWAWALVTGIGAGMSGFVGIERRPFLGAICAAPVGVLTPIAIVLYVALRIELSDSFFSIEFAIPALLAALPGIIAFRLIDIFAPSGG